MNPIPVLCDRCGAAGTAGEDPFAAFGALLDFAPVPRRKTRADGWDAEVQRAFIAALALTGSERAAARAVGKAQFGVTQLLACPGSEGFAAARAEAMAMAAGERSRRLAEGLRAIASEEAGWRPPPPPWSRAAGRAPLPHRIPQAAIPQAALAPPDPADEDAALRDGFQELERLLAAYVIKIHAERAARLAGHIVAADFYVRQICWFEVAIDLVSDDAIAVFEALRVEGRDLTLIARTPFSKMLDEARRLAWAQAAEPDRPQTPEDLLVDAGPYTIEPLPHYRGGSGETLAQWDAARHAEAEEAARAQAEWEERARAEATAWAKRLAAEPPETKETDAQQP